MKVRVFVTLASLMVISAAGCAKKGPDLSGIPTPKPPPGPNIVPGPNGPGPKPPAKPAPGK